MSFSNKGLHQNSTTDAMIAQSHDYEQHSDLILSLPLLLRDSNDSNN